MVSVPTSCIGSPRWVRVGVGSQGEDRGITLADPDRDDLFLDDANLPHSMREDSVLMGPKVRSD